MPSKSALAAPSDSDAKPRPLLPITSNYTIAHATAANKKNSRFSRFPSGIRHCNAPIQAERDRPGIDVALTIINY